MSTVEDDAALDEVDLEATAPKTSDIKQRPKELPIVPIIPNTDPLLVDINKVDLTPPNFLIEDAVETPCTGMIFGASGSGKSFFALDLALHCAAGVPWLGKATKEGPVVFVCGEGRHGIPRRVAAWKSKYGDVPDGRFMMSQRRVEFDQETLLEMVCEINGLAAKSEPPVLIVVDTMARSLPGDSDENSSRDIMNFLETCDKLQRQYNCVVLLVHHTGHAEGATRRARGSSAIKGAMDLEILLDGGKGVIEWTKQKDTECHLPIKYELVKTSYGPGKRDNSCVVKYDVTYNPAAELMTKPAKLGAETLAALCHKLGTVAIAEEVWRDAFYGEYGGAKEAKKKAFQRAKIDLEEKIKYIQIRGDTVYVISQKLQGDTIEMAMFGHLLGKTPNNLGDTAGQKGCPDN